MSTVATVLNGARYDLRNYADIDYDSTQMIHYLNRAVRILDHTLSAHNSDWTLNRETVTLLEGDSSVAVPTRCFNIREVWIDQSRLENLSQMNIYYKAEFRDGDATEPAYWSHKGDTIIFEVDAYEDYTVTVYCDIYATTLTSETDSMPYNGNFDNPLREAIVMMLQAKKYKTITDIDVMYSAIFESLVHQDAINRRFVKKNYRLDF